MCTLYWIRHFMSRSFFVEVNAKQFRGAAHGVVRQVQFAPNVQNFPKLLHPLRGLPKCSHFYSNCIHLGYNFTTPAKTCQAKLFAKIPQKVLDNFNGVLYNRRRGETTLWKNLHLSRKKYLTSSSYYCIIGAAAPKRPLQSEKILSTPAKKT